MTTFSEQVSAALDTHDALEAGPRVHKVVVDEIKALDPSVKAVDTGYFNHSFVPDLMIEWNEAGKKLERPVYLRHSLRSSRAAGDLEDLTRTDKSSLFLSLALDEPEKETNRARRAVRRNTESRTLITTVPALDELVQPSAAPDPVLGVVRASVIRSAKGIFTESDVENLVLPRERRIEAEDFERFSEAVQRNFSEEAVLRINRVSSIVEQALSETPDVATVLNSGRLTAPEIRELVPYLLSLEGVTQSREFWRTVAALISLEDIERLWGSFESGIDIGPLARAGSEIWRATRAQLSGRAEAIDDPDFDLTPKWSVRGKLLASEVGNWRVTYAFAGTKLKAPERDALPARWEDLRPNLNNYVVTDVNLTGLVTRGLYGATEGADMKNRIETFIEGADDSFHVPSVEVLTGVGDDQARIKSDFSRMLVQATPNASVETLTRVALDILGYRSPTSDADLDELLTGSRGESEATVDE